MARDPKEAAMMKIGQQRERDEHAESEAPWNQEPEAHGADA
jgi:hypothetical protein